jgi:hypothetical protein
MKKKLFFLLIITVVSFSCSSDSSSSNDTGGGSGVTPEVAMITRIDGVVYDTPPQGGGNTANATGGIYGNTYYLLNGYKNTGIAKVISLNKLIGNKVYEIKIAIPKSDISIGNHIFSSTITAGGYYADLDISGVSPAEVVNTTSGEINITNYNTTTKLIKGNFNFTTNNGVNLTTASHTLIGSFSYILP